MKYQNGTLWKANWPYCHIALLQVLANAKFCLLAYTERAAHGGTCLNVITDPDGNRKWQYDHEELEERLRDWSLLPDQSLRLEGKGMDIVDKLLDLQKQATLEHSHYYVAACVTEAIQEIVLLRQELGCRDWISIDDGPPQVGEYVIGATPVDDESWRIRIGRFGLPEDYGGSPIIELGTSGWSWISHWMPRPSPPDVSK